MNVPVYNVDFYDDSVILDPYPHYARMRALGPVVWLPENNVYALTRYAEVTEALRKPKLFISSKGLSLIPKVNELLTGSTLNSDPPVHDVTRAITGAPLLPGALIQIEDRIRTAANGLVEYLAERGEFDAISDFAQFLPVTIVAELVGLPDAGRENMLRWASATFNLFGSENARAKAAFKDLQELKAFLEEYGTPEMLKPGGWAARIFEVGPEHGLSQQNCSELMRDYINPSLDTTISATGQAIKFFADDPGQWDLVRQDPSLIPNAVEEVVRLASPIRAFSRYVAEDTEIGGVALPQGARVLVVYASANRDERKFPNPDKFDVHRDTHDHVGFGHGVHMCMGMHLARLEIVSLLQALARRVTRFELNGEPVVAMNNSIRAYESMPVRIEVVEASDEDTNEAEAVVQSDWLDVVVHQRVMEASDIVSLDLRAPDNLPLPAFEAGAHVDVQVKDGLVRQYSLSNDPAETHRYRLGILKDQASRGGSEAIHAGFTAGRNIRVGRPRNHFPLNLVAGHSILVAGGIGITPMLAMAHKLHSEQRSFELHYCARSADKVAFVAELAEFGEAVQIHLSDSTAGRRLNTRVVLASPQADRHLYVCGPNGFMDFVIDAAENMNWAPECIHLERFGAEVDTDGEPFTVLAARSGKVFEVLPGETIAEKLGEAGIEVRMSCQSGLCGTCLTPVLEGTPDHRDLVLTDTEKGSNERIAVCCSRSRTHKLVLDI